MFCACKLFLISCLMVGRYLIDVRDRLRVDGRHVNVALALGNSLQDPTVSKDKLRTQDVHNSYHTRTVTWKLVKENTTVNDNNISIITAA